MDKTGRRGEPHFLWKKGFMPKARNTVYNARGTVTTQMEERRVGCSGTDMMELRCQRPYRIPGRASVCQE